MPDMTYAPLWGEELIMTPLENVWDDLRRDMDAEEAMDSIAWIIDSWYEESRVEFVDRFIPVIAVAEILTERLGTRTEAVDAIYSLVYNGLYANDDEDADQ